MFKKFVQSAKAVKNFVAVKTAAVLGAVGLVAAATDSHAAAVLDFTGVGTAVTSELTPAIVAAMPIAGTILAAGIAWKLYKKFTS